MLNDLYYKPTILENYIMIPLIFIYFKTTIKKEKLKIRGERMRDYFHVNILNEGMIPLDFMEKGPYLDTIFRLVCMIYLLEIQELRTTVNLAKKENKEYLASKQPKKVEVVKPVERQLKD